MIPAQFYAFSAEKRSPNKSQTSRRNSAKRSVSTCESHRPAESARRRTKSAGDETQNVHNQLEPRRKSKDGKEYSGAAGPSTSNTSGGARAKTQTKKSPAATKKSGKAAAKDLPTFGMSVRDMTYIREHTAFSDDIIERWYNIVKEQYKPENDEERKVVILWPDVGELIAKVYHDQKGLMRNATSIFSKSDLTGIKFKHFMDTLYRITGDKTDFYDMKLDLIAYMCRDVEDSRGRVNRKTLERVLVRAGDLTTLQAVQLKADIEGVFESVKQLVQRDHLLNIRHFRMGLHPRIALHFQGRCRITNCVSDITIALLAMANYVSRCRVGTLERIKSKVLVDSASDSDDSSKPVSQTEVTDFGASSTVSGAERHAFDNEALDISPEKLSEDLGYRPPNVRK